MVTTEEYKKWLNQKQIHKVKKIESLDCTLLYEYGIPYMELDFLFFHEDLCTGEPLTNLYQEENYSEKFFKENKSKIENYIVLCQYLGSAVCLGRDKQIWSIDYNDFYTSFVNVSFEEFIEFWIVLDRELGNQRNEHSIKISHFLVEKIESEMRKIASKDWQNYDFWHFILECLDEDADDF